MGGIGSRPGKSFGSLTKPQNYYPPTHGPGPGGYNGSGLGLAESSKSGVGKNRSASYSMGSILPNVAFNQANVSPGPGAYGSPGFRSSIEGKKFNKNGGDRFGSEPRGNDKHLSDNRKNPGIGSY